MRVTELALLHLIASTAINDAQLIQTLHEAKKLMESFNGYRFYYLQQVEDPSYIYIVGEWDSVTQHYEEFIPGKENQAVLEGLKGKMDVEWLFHLDVPHAELPFPATSEKMGVWSIERHFIKPGEKEEFAKTFGENKHYVQDSVTEGMVGGGWRIDQENGKEEFVLFCPWIDVYQHMEFTQTEGFKKYRLTREHIDGAEIKHARLLEV